MPPLANMFLLLAVAPALAHVTTEKPPEETQPKQQVVAFYMEQGTAPVSYWLDYDWDILTHIITYGYNDPLMVRYAKSRGVKLLQATSCANGQMLNDTAVRAKVVRSALSFAPPPFGTFKGDNGTAFEGLFFDIECTTEPCPWLYPEIISGMDLFFKELKAAWPTVVISVYLAAPNPGQRIMGRNENGNRPLPNTPHCAAGVQLAIGGRVIQTPLSIFCMERITSEIKIHLAASE
jgi:hypothetical protein